MFQQPDSTRFSGQCEIQENALSSVVDGLTKRPPLKHIKKLFNSLSGTYTTHFIDRDENEKYVVIINRTGSSSTTYRIYNLLTGNQCSINGTTGAYTANSSTTPYLHPSVIEDLKFTTIGDTTFVCNSTVTTEQDTTSTYETPDYERKIVTFIKQGDYEKDYILKIGNDVVPRFHAQFMIIPIMGTPQPAYGISLKNQAVGFTPNSTSITGSIQFGVGGYNRNIKLKTDSNGTVIEFAIQSGTGNNFTSFSTSHLIERALEPFVIISAYYLYY